MSGPPLQLRLYVEGKNDLYVVKAICDRAGVLIGDKAIHDKEYPETLNAFSTQARKGSPVESLGLIVDADEDVKSRWMEIAKLLRELDIANVPNSPVTDGFVGILPNGCRVGVWLSPDNTNPGVIESLFMTLFRPDDPDMPLSQQYVDEFVPQRNWGGFDRLKADVYSWLAVRPNPGRPMGENISRTDFPGELSEPARRLAAWVKALSQPVVAD
jgi:hypothetical protein